MSLYLVLIVLLQINSVNSVVVTMIEITLKLCVPDVAKDMNIKILNLMYLYPGIKLVHVNVDQMQVFVMIKSVRTVKNADENSKK